MDTNLKVNVVVAADADMQLLDDVLERLYSRNAEIAVELTGSKQPRDLQSQISQWVESVYAHIQ